MSEIRTSRVEYRTGRELVCPTDTMYSSRNHESNSRVSTRHTCRKCDEQQQSITERDKQMKRRMRNINEYIKDLEAKFIDTGDDELTQSIMSFFNNEDDDDDQPHPGNNNEDSGDESDLVDLEYRMRRVTPSDNASQSQTQKRASGSSTRKSYRGREVYHSPIFEEHVLGNYLSN